MVFFHLKQSQLNEKYVSQTHLPAHVRNGDRMVQNISLVRWTLAKCSKKFAVAFMISVSHVSSVLLMAMKELTSQAGKPNVGPCAHGAENSRGTDAVAHMLARARVPLE